MLTPDKQYRLQRQIAVLQRTTREQKQEIEHNEHYIGKLQWEIKELKRKLFGWPTGRNDQP